MALLLVLFAVSLFGCQPNNISSHDNSTQSSTAYVFELFPLSADIRLQSSALTFLPDISQQEAEALSVDSEASEAVPENALEEIVAQIEEPEEYNYPMDQCPEPEIPETWVVDCNKSIGLRKVPYGAVVTGISKGKTVELLGWNDKYAKVSYNGRTGYVMGNYIKPQDEDYLSECLDVVLPTDKYAYNQMVEDMVRLKEQYPEDTTISVIGASAGGNYIPVLLLGDLESEYHVLVQGAIHGREHMTAWLVMAMTEYWLDQRITDYGDVCYHIIPMTNPDGVTISQTGELSDDQRQIYRLDRKKGYTRQNVRTYASLWKANGEGIDINRNFPSGWKAIQDLRNPSSEGYKGTEPFSSPEAAALRDYTLSYPFDATISYHATGSIIYYEYGKKEPVNSESESLGAAVTVFPAVDTKTGQSRSWGFLP